MKKNKMTQIVAAFALFGIIIGIVGTGILIIFSGGEQQVELTPEQMAELQQMIESQSGSIEGSASGTILDETSTGASDAQ